MVRGPLLSNRHSTTASATKKANHRSWSSSSSSSCPSPHSHSRSHPYPYSRIHHPLLSLVSLPPCCPCRHYWWATAKSSRQSAACSRRAPFHCSKIISFATNFWQLRCGLVCRVHCIVLASTTGTRCGHEVAWTWTPTPTRTRTQLDSTGLSNWAACWALSHLSQIQWIIIFARCVMWRANVIWLESLMKQQDAMRSGWIRRFQGWEDTWRVGREKLLNINYVAHWFAFRLPFCIINCIRDKRRVIAIEIINSKGSIVSGFNHYQHLIHSQPDRKTASQLSQLLLVYHSVMAYVRVLQTQRSYILIDDWIKTKYQYQYQ